MTHEELIARQAHQIADLTETVNYQKRQIDDATMYLVCVGGPLNGNNLGYSNEQLEYLQDILDILEP